MLVKLCSKQPLIACVGSKSFQQTAAYLAPALPGHIKRRLDKHKKVKLTDEDFKEDDNVQSPLTIKRERWARFGSLTNVHYAELFPSEREIAEEKEAEMRWWPTLERMQTNINKKKEEELKQRQEFERKVAQNMAKMPEWIAKYEAEQQSLQEKEHLREEKRMMEEDEAREKIGFDVPSKHPVLQQYLSQQREKLKKEKRKLLKLAKSKAS